MLTKTRFAMDVICHRIGLPTLEKCCVYLLCIISVLFIMILPEDLPCSVLGVLDARRMEVYAAVYDRALGVGEICYGRNNCRYC